MNMADKKIPAGFKEYDDHCYRRKFGKIFLDVSYFCPNGSFRAALVLESGAVVKEMYQAMTLADGEHDADLLRRLGREAIAEIKSWTKRA